MLSFTMLKAVVMKYLAHIRCMRCNTTEHCTKFERCEMTIRGARCTTLYRANAHCAPFRCCLRQLGPELAKPAPLSDDR
jgi:hypothetical protein